MHSKNNLPKRKHVRVPGYDYSQEGAYFVTICTNDKERLLSTIQNSDIKLLSPGEIVQHCWQDIPKYNPNVALDLFIIMPNHIHGILVIETKSATLGTILRSFKSASTKLVKQATSLDALWQRGYYEHIVRNNKDLLRIRQYITDNPASWAEDEYYRDVL